MPNSPVNNTDPNPELLARVQTTVETILKQLPLLQPGDPQSSWTTLKVWADQLNALLFSLWVAKGEAEDGGNWELVDKLQELYDECKSTCDAVYAAGFGTVLIINSSDREEMQNIRARIAAAVRLQEGVGLFIRLVGLIRKLL